jgi:hypothetical protein
MRVGGGGGGVLISPEESITYYTHDPVLRFGLSRGSYVDLEPVLRIRIRIHFVRLDPGPDWEYGSGSGGPK